MYEATSVIELVSPILVFPIFGFKRKCTCACFDTKHIHLVIFSDSVHRDPLVISCEPLGGGLKVGLPRIANVVRFSDSIPGDIH